MGLLYSYWADAAKHLLYFAVLLHAHVGSLLAVLLQQLLMCCCIIALTVIARVLLPTVPRGAGGMWRGTGGMWRGMWRGTATRMII